MFKTCICGSGNFVQEEDDDDNPAWVSSSSSTSSPNRRKIRSNSCKTNNNKNPYSNRGRDKFETVLAELEQRRQMIYEKYVGSQDQIEMIRFAYSNSEDCWVPIVVKLRDQKQKHKVAGDDHKEKKNSDHNSSEAGNMNKSSSSSSSSPNTEVSEEPKPDSDEMKKKRQRLVVILKNMVWWLCRYAYEYWAVMVIILIMLCLVIYGRSFAIICTCVFWYLMPLMKGNNKMENLNFMRRSMKKKKKILLKNNLFRSKSEQKMNTTTSTNNDGFSSPKNKMNLGSAGLSSSSLRRSLV